jgi:hypothetical protein
LDLAFFLNRRLDFVEYSHAAGAACLDLLQSTFYAFLDTYMSQIDTKQVIPKLNKMGQTSWF